jgi:hypothetical protein
MHLDASKFMKQLADEAHAIVLCGGTMSPVSQRHTRFAFFVCDVTAPRVLCCAGWRHHFERFSYGAAQGRFQEFRPRRAARSGKCN